MLASVSTCDYLRDFVWLVCGGWSVTKTTGKHVHIFIYMPQHRCLSFAHADCGWYAPGLELKLDRVYHQVSDGI